jgi:N-acetylglucosaminyl-diphospho-decaprenol L-rhamnosyltransferase
VNGTRSSVIIVSHRPGDWLEPCIRSVTGQASEVIVVDNGSTGRRAANLAERLGARAVPLRANTGFAGGVRAGLAQARGEIIGVLNDDAVAGPGWLDRAESALAAPDVAAVTPKVVLAGDYAEVVLDDEGWSAPGDHRTLGRQVRSITVAGDDVLALCLGAGLHELEVGPGDPPDRWRWTSGRRPFYVPLGAAGPGGIRVDGQEVPCRSVTRILNHAGSFLRSHGIAGEYGLGAPDDGRFDSPAERFGFSGTAPVFRAETLQRLGSFAPQFFAYNEDTDWCLRARLAGMRILYEPGAVVEHRLSATSGGTYAVRVMRLAQRNALLCLVRNAPAALAAREVLERLQRDWRGPVGRSLMARLPWAVASRRRLARQWVLRPEEVWARWADQDCDWDTGAAHASGPT